MFNKILVLAMLIPIICIAQTGEELGLPLEGKLGNPYTRMGIPIPYITARPTSGNAPLTVQFLGSSTYEPLNGWAWNFGDGSTSTERRPVHIYTTPGSYSVALRATNRIGQTTFVADSLITVGSDIPFIYAVSGTISHGSTVTLTGVSFGTKATAAPLKWDDFELGSAGSAISSVQSEWVNYGAPGANYSDVEKHSGTLSASNDEDPYNEFGTNYVHLTAADELYVSYWFTTVGASTSDYGVIKLCRLGSTLNNYNGAGVTFVSSMQPRTLGSPYLAYNNGSGETFVDYVSVPWNEWCLIETYVKLSTPGISNGSVYATVTSSSGRSIKALSNVMTRGPGQSFQMRGLLLGLMAANISGDYQLYIDDVYIDKTQSRVEIGNASTYTSCTHREIQIPTTWANGSVTITLNAGTFDPGPAWLYITDSTGRTSAGKQVTIVAP